MDRGAGGINPIHCAHLLRTVDEKLIDLLSSFAAEEWDKLTIATPWTVRDVAGRLLDTPLRKLSMVRHACIVEKAEIRSPRDLVEFVNR